jgi:hypothetical protein
LVERTGIIIKEGKRKNRTKVGGRSENQQNKYVRIIIEPDRMSGEGGARGTREMVRWGIYTRAERVEVENRKPYP